MFPLTQICNHFRDGFLCQGQISVPITYILIRGSESKSEPMEKSAYYRNPCPSLNLNPSLAMEMSRHSVAHLPCLSRLDAVVYTLGVILSKSLCSLCSPGLTLTREHGRKYKLYCGVLMAAKSRKDRNLPEIRPPWICTVISREEGE